MERKRKAAFHAPLLKLFIFWDTLPSLHSFGGGVPLRISRSPSLPISLCNSHICRRHERGARRDDGHTKTTKTDARYGTKACVTEWRSGLEISLSLRPPPLSLQIRLSVPVSPKGRKSLRLWSPQCAGSTSFVLFIHFFFYSLSLLLLQSVRESAVAMLKGIARPYLRWKLGIFSLSPLTLYPVRYSTHEGTPGTGMEGKGGGRRKPPKLAYTAGRSLCQ